LHFEVIVVDESPPVVDGKKMDSNPFPPGSESANKRLLNGLSLECRVREAMPEGMAKRFEDFVDSFIPEKIWAQGAVEVRRARILVGSTFAGLALGFFSTAGNYFWGSKAASAMSILIMCTIAFVPWMLKKTGDVVLMSCVLLTLVYVPITYSIYLQGGWASPAFRWLIVAPLVGTFFGGRKVGLLFGGLALAVSSTFYGLDVAGIEIASTIPADVVHSLHIVSATTLLAMVTFLSFTVDRTKELAFKALEKEISEREEAVRSLRASEARLAQAQRIAGIGCWELDLVRESGWWSDEHYHLYSMDPSEKLVSLTKGLELVALEDRGRVSMTVQEALRLRQPYRVEYKVVLPNGERRFYASIGKPIYDEQGTPILLTGATQDVTEMKLAEQEKELLQQELLRASHQAGMAEVSTELLHNMGNALSSLKTTTSVMEEALADFKTEGLLKASEMIEEHEGDLARFLSEDSRGSRFPAYFRLLASHIEERHALISRQLHDMKRSLTQVDTIVGSQQSYASFCSVREEVLVDELLEEALRVNATGIGLNGIRIKTKVHDSPKLLIDRHRLLQILVVLVKNAVEAVSPIEGQERWVSVGTHRQSSGEIIIEVEDNGVGIREEDRTRIFAFGYTTKKASDGLGLHTAALAAEILGGSLEVSSEGPRSGSKFTLVLPEN
jgi:signal transduction histidine kinase